MKLLAILFCVIAFVGGYATKSLLHPISTSDENAEAKDESSNTSILGTVKTESGRKQDSGSDPTPTDLSSLMAQLASKNIGEGWSRFYASLHKMDSQQLDKLIAEVGRLPNSAEKRMLIDKLADYLAAVHPEKALVLQKHLPESIDLDDVYRQFGRFDPEKALALLAQETRASDRRKALDEIIRGASEEDPAGAFALLKGLPDARMKHYERVFESWAALNPQAAAEEAIKIESAGSRNAALKALGEEWAKNDPIAALKWAENAELTNVERQRMLGKALESFAESDPKAALDKLESSDLVAKNQIIPDIISKLMVSDADAALDWLNKQDNVYQRRQVLDDIASDLASDHPEELIKLAEKVPEFKDRVLDNAFNELAKDDFDKAVSALAAWEGDAGYADLVEDIAKGASENHPEKVVQWAIGLDEASRGPALNAALEGMSESDPEGAAALLAQHGGDLGSEPDAYEAVAENWAKTDPANAASWANELPEGKAKNNAVEQVAKEWVDYDPISLSAWVSELPMGDSRDLAVQELVGGIRKDDPLAAYQWGATIADEGNRQDLMEDIFESWLEVDKEGALKTLQADGSIDQALRNKLLERSER